MHQTAFDGSRRRHQRLAKHLAAEDLRRADVAAFAAEKIVLEPLEIEQFQHLRKTRVHGLRFQSGGATPSRSRMIGLVVVYCRNWRFSG